MKNLLIGLILGITILHPVTAQNKFYNFTVSVGVSPKQSPVQASLIMNREDPMNEYQFNLSEIEKKYTFGFRTNVRFSRPFFGTMGLEYSRQREHYSMLFTHQAPDGRKDHQLLMDHNQITMPVGVGVMINKIEITSGLKMEYNLKSKMNMDMDMDIEMNRPGIEMGWFTGIGFVQNRTRVGIEYQASLSRYGNDISHHQQPMELKSLPGNFRFSIGYSF